MTGRKVKTAIFCVFAVVAVLALWILTLPFASLKKAHADGASSHDEVFGADHSNSQGISSLSKEISSGDYHLTDDIKLTAQVELNSANVRICLHGHTITADSSSNSFRIYGDSVLAIYDCGGAGKISGGKGVRVQGGTFNMYGGTVTGVSSFIDGGVTVNGGVFNMYGGAVSGNTVTGDGGAGVNVAYMGTFNMYGGTISNNTVKNLHGGAGVLVGDASAEFHMYGGTITNNTVVYPEDTPESTIKLFYRGAGVYVNGGQFTVEGNPVITGNVRGTTTDKLVDNVELGSNCKIEITGPLEEGAKIGVTVPEGYSFTEGYKAAGNTEDPSKFFTADDGGDIGFDSDNMEGGVVSGGTPEVFDEITSYWVSGAVAATIGDTSLTFTVTIKLKGSFGNTKEITDVVTVQLDAPLVDSDLVGFDYIYNGSTLHFDY